MHSKRIAYLYAVRDIQQYIYKHLHQDVLECRDYFWFWV